MSEDLQELQRQILEHKQARANLKQKIKRLKTESGLKLETIIRHQEKKNALAMEAKDREEEYRKLEEGLKDKLELRKKSPKKAAETGFHKFSDSEERERLIEKFAFLLEHNISNPIQHHIQDYMKEAYGLGETEHGEHEGYVKSPYISTILVVLEEEVGGTKKKRDERNDTANEEVPLTDEEQQVSTVQQYLATFRVSQATSISDLKKVACDFWKKSPDNYEFYDEEDHKKDSGKLERFFKDRRNEFSQFMLVLKRRQEDDPNILEIRNSKTEKENRLINVGDNQEEHNIDPYKNFDLLLPKLKPYISIDRLATEERDKKLKKINEPKTFGENHVTIVSFLLILLILTIVSISSHKNIRNEYNVVGNIQRRLNFTMFNSIANLNELFETVFFNITPWIPDDNETSLRLIKPIYIRQYRVKETPCQINLSGKKCYFKDYNSDTMNTTDPDNDYYSYVTNDQPSGIKGVISGRFGDYGLDSYYSEIPINNNADAAKRICLLFATSQKSKDTCIQYLQDQGQDVTTFNDTLQNNNPYFINAETRAIRISINFFEIVEENFYIAEPLIEFTPYGTILSSTERIIAFRPNFKDSFNKGQLGYSIACVVFATFLLIFVLYNLFTTGNGGINFYYFMTLQGTLNLIIIILIYAIHTLINSFDGYHLTANSILDSGSIVDALNDLASRYDTIFILKSMLAGVLIVRVLLVFKLNTRVEIIVHTLETVIPSLSLMIITLAPILLGLAFFGHYTLGLQNFLFASYRGALMVVSLLLIGFQAEIVNSYNVPEAIMIFFGIFFVYSILLSLVAAINVENYRQLKLDYSEDFHKRYTWRMRDYVSWLFAWVPSRLAKTRQKLKSNLSGLKTNLKLNKVSNLIKKKENKYKVGDTSERPLE